MNAPEIIKDERHELQKLGYTMVPCKRCDKQAKMRSYRDKTFFPCPYCQGFGYNWKPPTEIK